MTTDKKLRKQQLKVYGGNLDGRHRVIVAANSLKRVQEILEEYGERCSLHYLSEMWSVTGNEKELNICLAEPGKPFKAIDDYSRYYQPMKKLLKTECFKERAMTIK